MVPSELPAMDDDRQMLNYDPLKGDLQPESYSKNQGWTLLSKGLQIYLLWLLSMIIAYVLTFAIIAYVRSLKSDRKVTDGDRAENYGTSVNATVTINDKDFYPILDLVGDQSAFYLKDLDIDKFPKSKKEVTK